MGFCGFGELAAYVDITLRSDAVAALEEIGRIRVEGVTVHEVSLAFGDVDIIAAIKTPLTGTKEHPTMNLARWVNEVAKKGYVAKTTTRILVHDPAHDARMREREAQRK